MLTFVKHEEMNSEQFKSYSSWLIKSVSELEMHYKICSEYSFVL